MLLTARLVPSVLAGAIGSSLAVIVIPLFQRTVLTRGAYGPRALFRRVTVIPIVAYAIAFSVIVPAAQSLTHLLAPGYSGLEVRLSATLLAWSLPVSLLECIGLTYIGFLQAEKRFVSGAAASLANAAVGIPVVLLSVGKLGIWGVFLGWAVGTVVQTIVLSVALRTNFRRYDTAFEDDKSGRSEVLQWGIPVLLGTIIANIIPFTERGVASGLAPGSIAIVNWAQKILNVPLGFLVLPMVTAIYPYLAELRGGCRETRADDRMRRSIFAGLYVLVPVSIVLILLRYEIVAVLFMRGAFGAPDVLRAGSMVGCYGAGLVCIGTFLIGSRIAYGLRDPWGPTMATAVSAALYVPAAVVLVRIMGLSGLAIAYSACMFVACVVLGIRLVSRGGVGFHFSDLVELGRIALAGVLMTISVVILERIGAGIHVPRLDVVLHFAVYVVTGGVVYVGTSLILKSNVLLDLAARFRWGRVRRESWTT